MGKAADDVLKSFGVCRNTIFERVKFYLRKQEEGESVDQFITSLYTLAEHCDYCAFKKVFIWDIAGLLLASGTLKFPKRITI